MSGCPAPKWAAIIRAASRRRERERERGSRRSRMQMQSFPLNSWRPLVTIWSPWLAGWLVHVANAGMVEPAWPGPTRSAPWRPRILQNRQTNSAELRNTNLSSCHQILYTLIPPLLDHQTLNSKVLRIDRAQVNDSGLYECRAGYPRQMLGLQGESFNGGGEQLRKVVRLIVNGK